MKEALYSFEKFLHNEPAPLLLVLVGLAHAQFESIHPFLDGNGRVGRLLITFLLVHGGALRAPLLSLSYYLKVQRSEYYDRLMAVRTNGDWEGWLGFFLRGVAEIAGEASDKAERTFELNLLSEVTGQRRSRILRYEPYLRLFDEPTETEQNQRVTPVTDSG
jgi:Fic family protein